MIIKKLSIWNFRKFSAFEEKPGVLIKFNKGINALIGENNSGKTAIVDAIKLILQTQSNEYYRIVDEDFHISKDGIEANEFKIECTFEDFTDDEAKNFLEWLQFTKDEDGNISYYLNVKFRAWKEKNRIFSEFKAGINEEGYTMDGKARELLKCTYLKPLRDAGRELQSGRSSRISQILYNHSVFSSKEDHALVEIIHKANEEIEKYFIETSDGIKVLGKIKDNLNAFLSSHDANDACLSTSDMRLKSILESLSLNTSEIQSGLGMQNLLFIAAELILLNQEENHGLKLALIEEVEAHLHPQAQLRLIDYIQKEYNNSGIQFIISTHSTTLSSKINIKNALICKDDKVYSLSPENTMLKKGDYLFLQRFLDSTKANLFFAQGVIMVEGDAENLLIPTIADIIDLPLSKHGVSIVNIGSTAFRRYANIFNQKDGTSLGIPVSIVTDSDVRVSYEGDELDSKKTETKLKISEIKDRYCKGSVKAFVAPNWTLEFTLALSGMKKLLLKSILFAGKIENSDKYALTLDKIIAAEDVAEELLKEWKSAKLTKYEIAYNIYQKQLLDSNVSKAVTAQCLSSLLQYSILDKTDDISKDKMFDLDLNQLKVDEKFKNKLKTQILASDSLSYIVEAIKYATRSK